MCLWLYTVLRMQQTAGLIGQGSTAGEFMTMFQLNIYAFLRGFGANAVVKLRIFDF